MFIFTRLTRYHGMTNRLFLARRVEIYPDGGEFWPKKKVNDDDENFINETKKMLPMVTFVFR